MALCIEVVRPALEAMGGKIVAAGYLFGEYGFVLLAEVPGGATATGIELAVVAGGAFRQGSSPGRSVARSGLSPYGRRKVLNTSQPGDPGWIAVGAAGIPWRGSKPRRDGSPRLRTVAGRHVFVAPSHEARVEPANFRRRVSCRPCRVNPAQLVKHRLAGHGCWQTGGVEPVAEVPAGERGGRAGQRGRYGIDGGFAGMAVFGVIEAGLAGTVAWAVRHRRSAVAALAGVGGAEVAGSAASYLYSTGPGKRAI